VPQPGAVERAGRRGVHEERAGVDR
jgi:hypothetical protein